VRWPLWADVLLALGVCALSLAELGITGQKLVSVLTVAVATLPLAPACARHWPPRLWWRLGR